MRRRSVRTQPRPRRACSALPTASREDPVHPASSSWESGSVILTPVADGLAVALGELHEPRGDAPERVVRAELDALTVGVAQPAGEHLQEQNRDARVRGEECPELACRHDRGPRPARVRRPWPTVRPPSMAESSPSRSPGPRNASTTSLPSAVTVETFTRPESTTTISSDPPPSLEQGGAAPIPAAPASPE